ncbi:acyl carrier protein [Streptomyces ipomoeae]|jgi:acyl carrier protein|uniref:Phosphopantetheine attachment domain protein n=2 Tax=Streptomyces ipomoeae TaxID=103232 RepID=L1L2H4_9ACTN|nr:acyl carrier protein [Streptomyces ipomoeae]EKX66895.1 phosphopantetheine attachment domain protein [Streptomyces ipomoeae 91-03]MDX2693198.1 acyl carrier protein [Streptomyces ipomoeae]MDX2820641.1 acyl carrier protein [Streptomyces ipomoeae]MDX2838690.1 acyl carrier protein [Streptomyces ipomoeae]MDX2873149.1 acyl carrier protein [Streptomyces ipomoeae]
MAETGITESDVRQLLVAVGVSPATAGRDLDRSFEELGMDSLARIEIASRVMERFGVEVEEDLTAQETPAGMRQLVNQRLTEATA